MLATAYDMGAEEAEAHAAEMARRVARDGGL
jgi:hypothetical protein